MITVDSPATV